MSEDYLNNDLHVYAAELATLHTINSLLEPMRNNVNDYNLVDFHVGLDLTEKALKLINDELEMQVSDDYISVIDNLNHRQKITHDMIIEKVLSYGFVVFFFLLTVLMRLRRRTYIILCSLQLDQRK